MSAKKPREINWKLWGIGKKDEKKGESETDTKIEITSEETPQEEIAVIGICYPEK